MMSKSQQQSEYSQPAILKTSGAVRKHASGTYNKGKKGSLKTNFGKSYSHSKSMKGGY